MRGYQGVPPASGEKVATETNQLTSPPSQDLLTHCHDCFSFRELRTQQQRALSHPLLSTGSFRKKDALLRTNGPMKQARMKKINTMSTPNSLKNTNT